jgi:hypothetical protein
MADAPNLLGPFSIRFVIVQEAEVPIPMPR